MAQFRLHEGSQYVVAFGHQKNTVVILGMDGRLVHRICHFQIIVKGIGFLKKKLKCCFCSFYRCRYDPAAGGEMTQLEFYNFLKPEGAF